MIGKSIRFCLRGYIALTGRLNDYWTHPDEQRHYIPDRHNKQAGFHPSHSRRSIRSNPRPFHAFFVAYYGEKNRLRPYISQQRCLRKVLRSFETKTDRVCYRQRRRPISYEPFISIEPVHTRCSNWQIRHENKTNPEQTLHKGFIWFREQSSFQSFGKNFDV